VELTREEQEMLRGERGPAIQRALEYQVKVGEFFGAQRFVAVTGSHVMGDIEVLGDSGHDFLRRLSDQGGRCAISTTINPRCTDFRHWEALGQEAQEIEKEKSVIEIFRRMGCAIANTCINYQTLHRLKPGEHVAWGDTGTVIYANSVFGARSNFESGPAALAAALTGRVPEYGFHLDHHRRGSILVKVKAAMADLADWGALGKIIGHSHQDYYTVPVFTGVERPPSSDELKHLGASLAAHGSIAMFHMVGVTPEAPTLEASFGGGTPGEEITVTDDDIERVFAAADVGDGACDLVVFSGPQLSLSELGAIADLLGGRKVHPDTQLFLTAPPAVIEAAERLGHAAVLTDCGATILEGVCFYILQNLSKMKQARGWTNVVSNSAKLVNNLRAHGFNTVLRRTAACVDAAIRGRVS
jgi:predicted aconitase